MRRLRLSFVLVLGLAAPLAACGGGGSPAARATSAASVPATGAAGRTAPLRPPGAARLPSAASIGADGSVPPAAGATRVRPVRYLDAVRGLGAVGRLGTGKTSDRALVAAGLPACSAFTRERAERLVATSVGAQPGTAGVGQLVDAAGRYLCPIAWGTAQS